MPKKSAASVPLSVEVDPTAVEFAVFLDDAVAARELRRAVAERLGPSRLQALSNVFLAPRRARRGRRPVRFRTAPRLACVEIMRELGAVRVGTARGTRLDDAAAAVSATVGALDPPGAGICADAKPPGVTLGRRLEVEAFARRRYAEAVAAEMRAKAIASREASQALQVEIRRALSLALRHCLDTVVCRMSTAEVESRVREAGSVAAAWEAFMVPATPVATAVAFFEQWLRANLSDVLNVDALLSIHPRWPRQSLGDLLSPAGVRLAADHAGVERGQWLPGSPRRASATPGDELPIETCPIFPLLRALLGAPVSIPSTVGPDPHSGHGRGPRRLPRSIRAWIGLALPFTFNDIDGAERCDLAFLATNPDPAADAEPCSEVA